VVVLPVHHACLKALLNDLIYEVETFGDPIVDSQVSKSK
jgi:hypothetical protein